MIIRRPFVWMLVVLIFLFLLYRAFHSERDDARYYIFQGVWEEEIFSDATGEVERVALRGNGEERDTSICLKNCRLRLKDGTDTIYYLKRLLVCCDGETDLEPGNRLSLSGRLQEFSSASNPGQFDQKNYYKEKGIFYQFQAREVTVADARRIRWKCVLAHIRETMGSVYERCLPQREGGVVKAMMLGDKSLLDLDVKKLYQESGIGHLLAISGLHVSILGMACYRLLRRLCLPVGTAVPCAVLVILSYGYMTDFSISTCRAVIMLVLLLAAEWVGRTYDGRNALALSAVVILLQKPFALFSCSFLLSFGAMAGIELLLPALRLAVYGDEGAVRERRRRDRRREREWRANYRLGVIPVKLFRLRDYLISLFLTGLSVQLMTFPVLLYFFYQIPVYGIFLNLLVIPLASAIVLLSFAGGLLGCVCLPLGKLALGTVFYLLQFYEAGCHFFTQLPGHMQILGRPAAWRILLYYGALFLLCVAVWYRVTGYRRLFSGRGWSENRGEPVSCRRGALWLTVGVFVLGLLFVPLPDGHFHMTMLDVGQGDSIFLHAGTGQNMLVDGGSTSVSGVGEYRILPFLKYCGVRQLDYVVMTHDDEDHVNGLLTVLEESGRGGPVVKNLLVPDVADRPDEGGRKLTALARERKIPVTRLSAGDTLRAGDLLMTCLNPVKQLRTESANAGSVTLSLRFQGFSCLLTGDLEGEGQEQVKRILERDRERYLLPSSYTVLKVAHHGSKNSSDEEFLRLVSPQLSLISCGKNNRYGHPHRELLERLHATGARVYLTPQHGAVSLRYDGAAPEVEWRRPDGGEKKINDK